RGRLVVAFALADQHVGAVGGEGEFGERAGKARAWLDQRDQRARSDIDALEHALPEIPDLPREPMIFVGIEKRVVGQDLRRIARGLEHDRGNVELVEPDIEDRIVKLAREAKRPELRPERLSVTRVSPPVPGSTAKSGSSGSDTAVAPSSIRMM